MPVRYRLVVLTHGRAPALERTLDSFFEMVTPSPAECVLVVDGPGATLPPHIYAPQDPSVVVGPLLPSRARRSELSEAWRVVGRTRQGGFCKATKTAWEQAARPGADYTFHLENDFEFLRPVDLRDLATVLDLNADLAQMALMRDAVSQPEKAAGGLFESRPGQWAEGETEGVLWLKEHEFFTTNPSLMRREFMEQNPWPNDGQPSCEGHFGIALRDQGYSFGYLGRGEVWVRHIGARTGFGY